MILSQIDIRTAVEAEEIGFDPPLEEGQWGEASVDLRLGFSFTKFREVPGVTVSVAQGLASIGGLRLWDTKVLREQDELGKPDSFVLEPGEFVLALTHESVRIPNHLIALVEGRSTYGRVGLSMHQTAPWIQPGWSGRITLEMMNHGPLRIELTPLVDRPCQLTFFELKSPLPDQLGYGTRPSDRYRDQDHPLVHDNGDDAS